MNQRSKTKSAIINSAFNFLYQIINMVVNLIIPPLLISKFGSAINGLVSTIKQIINYVQLVGAGISESTVVALYKPIHNNDQKKISSVYNACNSAFNNSGVIFSVISIVVSFIYPLFILKENLNYFTIVFLVLSLCIAGASEFFVIGKYRSLLIADQKLYIVNIAQIIGAILSAVAVIIAINLDFNIVIVQLLASFAYILRLLILTVYINKKYKFLDKSIEKDMDAISRRKDATVHQLASLIMFGSQTLFIANFCGLKEASVYSVYSLIFTGINTILATFSSAILPSFGNIIANDTNEKLNKVFNLYELLFYILTFTCFSVAFIMIVPFINIYVGDIADINYIRNDLIILFVISGVLNCVRTPAATIINAGGFYKETKNRAIIEMTICIVMQFLLVHKFQISGILIGTIVAYMYRTIDVFVFSHKKILLSSLFSSIKRVLGNSIVLFMVIVLSNQFLTISINNYIFWGIYAIIIFIICFLIYFIYNLIFDFKCIKNLKLYIHLKRG